MDARRLAYLKALEIDVWERRDVASSAPPVAVNRTDAESIAPRHVPHIVPAPVESATSSSSSPLAALGWEELTRTVKACTLCPLHASRTQAVFGVGNRNAQWMVIGEAPGADEDRQGEPFVGRAGQLLNSMLEAIGFARSDVFIANILKSRPPNNRDPRPEEVQACIPYLYRQIELIDPKLILCVGRIAAQTLLQTDTPIGKLRGKLHRIAGGRPMIVTYHPAYLLRSPAQKRLAWRDILSLKIKLESLGSNS
ncbi:MAG: uracil-DNA glycosylase [Steroidobacteraceae bacterium]